MINRAELKNMAKAQIKGNIGVLFIVTLIVFGITFLASLIPVVGGLISGWALSPAFSISLIMIYLGVAKGIKPEISQVFDGFYDMWCAFKVYFLASLFTSLWSLLFIIPGIIKGYSYLMAPYILAENKGMPALEAISRSKELTDGYKMDLFVLQLSFLGYILLGLLTFGIAYIWVIPYMATTEANFYNTLKAIKNPQDTYTQPVDVQIEEYPQNPEI